MVDLASERDIVTVPKAEMHVHLQGAISETTAKRLARRHGAADVEAALKLVSGRYPGRYPNFQGFLDAYLAANEYVRTPDDLELVAAEFAMAQAAQSIRYTEVIFTPMIAVRNGMDPADMWSALRRGLSAGAPSARIGLVIDAIRDFGRPEADATLRLVDAADAPIVGMALTGIEGRVPAEEFVEFREGSRRLGLGFEVHAGENGPASSVVEALDVLLADRIGHGLAVAGDSALLERFVRDRVVLEVCPSSNVRTGHFPSLQVHPVKEFWRAGVNMTISSDDPAFFQTTLTDELRNVVRIVGLSRHDLGELQRRAIRHSFASADIKVALQAELERWLAGA
jgi:aminodeoxyfutalosine deaminase